MLTNWESSITLFMFNIIVYILLQFIRVFIDPYLPTDRFDEKQGIYQSFSWEENGKIYDRIFKVSKWKDYLPTVNSVNKFDKRHINGRSIDYFNQFILEINMAESHHIRSILSTLIFALWNPSDMFILFFLLSFIIQSPFIIIQRYNRPRIEKLISELRIREEIKLNSKAI